MRCGQSTWYQSMVQHGRPSCGAQGMGFDAVKAREALEEADCDLDAAIEWLLACCV